MSSINPIPSEADVAAWKASDEFEENTHRANGNFVRADELRGTRTEREARVRADLGVAAPAAPDPAAVRAAGYGIDIRASATTYKGADLSGFASLTNEVGVEEMRGALADTMAAMQVDAATGKFLMEFVGTESAKLAKMSAEDRQTWAENEARTLEPMAKMRGTTANAMIENAKEMLRKSTFGKRIADGALPFSPTIALTLWDHRTFTRAHQGMK